MAEELETAQRFRFRAEEIRTIAADVRDKTVKDSLYKIAEDYEKIAKALIAMDESNAMLRELARSQK